MAKRKANPLKPKLVSKYQRGPLWDWTKGVTQSSLESFLACREQFALNYIEGWTARAFSTPLEFGTMFHLMLERIGSADPRTVAREVTKSYHDARKKTLKGSADELNLACTNAEALFPLYVETYKEEDAKYNWLEHEAIFKIPHKFLTDTGKTVEITLTGMRDKDFRDAANGLGLFETKTKSQLDDITIQDGLRADLQTMLYLYSLRRQYGEEPKSILYNCIRRPQLRLKSNETLQAYGLRLQEDVKDRPDWYFRRYEVTVLPGDIETFVDTTLDPVLRLLYNWWESVKDHPFDRWTSPYHYRDLTKLMNRYGRVPLYNLMILGRKSEYYQRLSPFPELEESLLTQEA